MKKFFFRMETLLKIRKAREGTLKRDMDHANKRWNQLKEREKMLLNQMASLNEEIKKKRMEGKLQLHETYTQILEHLQSSLEQIQSNLAAQYKQIVEHKERLKQAIQERKVIEKIKEKQYAGWRLRQAQTEENLIDEISCQKSADPQ